MCSSTNRTSICQQSLYLRCVWKNGWAPNNSTLNWRADNNIWFVGERCTPYNKTCLTQIVNNVNKLVNSEVKNCTKYTDSNFINTCVHTPQTCFRAYAEPLCDNLSNSSINCYTRYVQHVSDESSEINIMEKYYKEWVAPYILLRAKWAKDDPCLGPNSYDATENYCLITKQQNLKNVETDYTMELNFVQTRPLFLILMIVYTIILDFVVL